MVWHKYVCVCARARMSLSLCVYVCARAGVCTCQEIAQTARGHHRRLPTQIVTYFCSVAGCMTSHHNNQIRNNGIKLMTYLVCTLANLPSLFWHLHIVVRPPRTTNERVLLDLSHRSTTADIWSWLLVGYLFLSEMIQIYHCIDNNPRCLIRFNGGSSEKDYSCRESFKWTYSANTQ